MNEVNDEKMEIYIRLKRQKQYDHYEPFFISNQDVSFSREKISRNLILESKPILGSNLFGRKTDMGRQIR